MSKDREESEAQLDAADDAERRTLFLILGINFGQVLLAGSVGLVVDSTGLLGAALDNLSDAGVYVVSIYAVGRSVTTQARAARLSGLLLIVLALVLLGEVLRRFATGSDPVGIAMMLAGILNAAANLLCLRLLRAHRERGVHMKASWIFTTNDMLVNVGVVVSGAAVTWFESQVPDLLIGVVVAGIVLKGGWDILSEAAEALRSAA